MPATTSPLLSSQVGHALLSRAFDLCIFLVAAASSLGFHSYDFSLTLIWISVAGFLSTSLWQIKKRKLKDDKKRKEIEVQKAKEEQLSKKRQREERRERYREQDKLKKKIRRNAED
ncbi:unnamed protein product [Prunus armeniaca]